MKWVFCFIQVDILLNLRILSEKMWLILKFKRVYWKMNL
jgi:hypothetical protein